MEKETQQVERFAASFYAASILSDGIVAAAMILFAAALVLKGGLIFTIIGFILFIGTTFLKGSTFGVLTGIDKARLKK